MFLRTAATVRSTRVFTSPPTAPTPGVVSRMSTTTKSDTTKPDHYILSFYVPSVDTSKVMTEVCKSGAGSFPGGLYTEAYWITNGTGQFRPTAAANPHIGKAGVVEKVEEDKVEVLCVGKETVENAVKMLLDAHPYEQVPYYVIKSEI